MHAERDATRCINRGSHCALQYKCPLHPHNTEAFPLPQTLLLCTQTKRTNRRFFTSRTVKVRPHAKRCTQLKFSECVDRWHGDETPRNNIQEHGSTTERMQKWDQLAAALTQYRPVTKEHREHVAQKWQLVETSRGGQNTTKSTDHPKYSVAHHLKPRSTESPKVARCTQRRKIPCTDAIAELSVPFKQLTCIITKLAMDKLGLVTKLVELNFPSRRFEVSGPRTLEGTPTLQTGGVNEFSLLLKFFSLAFSLVSSCPHFVHTVQSRMDTWLEAHQPCTLCEQWFEESFSQKLPPYRHILARACLSLLVRFCARSVHKHRGCCQLFRLCGPYVYPHTSTGYEPEASHNRCRKHQK